MDGIDQPDWLHHLLRQDHRFPWSVNVAIAGGRERRLRIGVDDGRVVVWTPPGEGMALTPAEATRASAYFAAASKLATASGNTP